MLLVLDNMKNRRISTILIGLLLKLLNNLLKRHCTYIDRLCGQCIDVVNHEIREEPTSKTR